MREAIVVVGLTFGDEGKGSIVDFLCRTRPVHTVVRYNGGSQAAHNVVTPTTAFSPGGTHHEFHQFGSGTLCPDVRTHLSRYMLIDPLAMMREETALRKIGVPDAFERTTIDPNAVIITPFHVAANRLKEVFRGDARHGSCGRGIGETRADQLAGHVLTAKMLREPGLKERLAEIQLRKYTEVLQAKEHSIVLPNEADMLELRTLTDPEAPAITRDLYNDFTDRVYLDHLRLAGGGTVVFEGAQGVLIDETHGFPPYNTWTDTTAANAIKLMREQVFDGRVVTLGVTRTYMVRHGPGPFPSEDKDLTRDLPEGHNTFNEWQRDVRAGWPDMILLEDAVRWAGKVDAIALTHMDRWAMLDRWRACMAHNFAEVMPGDTATSLLMRAIPVYDEHQHAGEIITEMSKLAPVKITSFGPTADTKCYREKL